MKEEIMKELKEHGINPIGSYAKLPEIIEYAIDTVRAFGYETWVSNSTVGTIIKKIVEKLA